jgi:hypothetical protein
MSKTIALKLSCEPGYPRPKDVFNYLIADSLKSVEITKDIILVLNDWKNKTNNCSGWFGDFVWNIEHTLSDTDETLLKKVWLKLITTYFENGSITSGSI